LHKNSRAKITVPRNQMASMPSANRWHPPEEAGWNQRAEESKICLTSQNRLDLI